MAARTPHHEEGQHRQRRHGLDHGARQMLAVIGDSANAGSIGVHRTLGFELVGVMKSSGWKFDRWVDVVIMQKALGSGDTAPPPADA